MQISVEVSSEETKSIETSSLSHEKSACEMVSERIGGGIRKYRN